MTKIWHRPGHEWPYTVWEGDPNGSASGRDYRSRWRAILYGLSIASSTQPSERES